MVNYYEYVKSHPDEYKQFSCKDLLFLLCECPPDFKKTIDWSEHNCFTYVISGQLIMNSRSRSWHLAQGDTVFLKKGACEIEKTEYHSFCSLMFYVPDEYIRYFTRQNVSLFSGSPNPPFSRDLLFKIETNDILAAFFDSVISYFIYGGKPPADLIELKFKELLLNILSNPANSELKAYFHNLTIAPADDLRDVMERNYLYDLELKEYARLCHRSLSSFKRDFCMVYGMPPGRWLLEKRLDTARHLLLASDLSIEDVALESGFKNNAHFSRVFKDHFSTSPLQCRKKALSFTDQFS